MTESALIASIFGKLPARADFVRVAASDAIGQRIETWLVDAVEKSRGEVPSDPVRFLFVLENTPLVGVWIASRDEVGRAFPLAAFSRVSPELVELGWSVLPAFFDAYLAGLEAALHGALAQSAEAVACAARAVEAPHPSAFVRAIFEADARAESERISQFSARVFGEADTPMAYALFTLREAQRREGAGPTLDCPVREPYDSYVWLSLLRGVAPHSAAGLVWSQRQGRALASFGAPPALVTAFLLDAAHPATSRWPVASNVLDKHAALAHLSADLRATIEADDSMAALARVLRSSP